MADVEKCFICEQLLGSDVVKVKERGVKTFEISNKKRKEKGNFQRPNVCACSRDMLKIV